MALQWHGSEEPGPSEGTAQHSTIKEHSEIPTQGLLQPSKIKKKNKGPLCTQMPKVPAPLTQPAPGMLSPSFQRPM